MKKFLGLAAILALIALVASCALTTLPQADEGSDLEADSRAVTTGKVNFTVLADYVEGGVLKSAPLNQVGIFNGYYGAGLNVGYTNSYGKATVTLPAGTSVYTTFFKMTSSHSTLFAQKYLKVVAGSTVSSTVNLCPTQVSIIAHYRVPYGKALYVTGQSNWLGNWGTAYKMSYRDVGGDSQWTLQKNLPLGAQFKIVMADWVSGETRSVSGVTWMKGNNAVIAAPYQSYESVNNLWPTF